MISKSFLKSSIVFTAGGALPMIASIILLPFYTNRLSTDHYTQLVFYISVSLLLQILFSFSVETYFGIRYTQLSGNHTKQRKFIGTIAILLLILGAVLLTVTSVFGETIFNLVYEQDLLMSFWPYGFSSVLTAFFNSFFKTSSVCLIYLKKRRLFLAANVINFIATVALSAGGLYLYPDSLIGPVYGRLISGIIIFGIGLYFFISHGIFKFDFSFIRDLALFCAPYLVFVLSGWILGHIDRYILQSFIPNHELNTYDLILKCFFGIEFLQNSLTAVIYPQVYQIWNNNRQSETTPESNRYFNVFTALNVLMLIGFCLIIPPVFRLLINNPLFYESERYIGLISAGYSLRSILNLYLATILYQKKISVLLKIFGASAILQIFATYFLIGCYGVIGAIYASLITKVVQIAFCYLFTKPIFKYKINFLKIYGIPALFIIINLLIYVWEPEYTMIGYTSQLLLFSFLIYILYKNEIVKLLKTYKILKSGK